MDTLQEQLAVLRQKIRRIDRKYANQTGREPDRQAKPVRGRSNIEELMSGEVVQTAFGAHFETEQLWELHRRHGSVDISELTALPEDLLASLSEGAIARAHPGRWAFLDTETTGLAGGTGTYAFLIGVGSIGAEGFRLRQFFMRDYGEEPSLLARLAEHLDLLFGARRLWKLRLESCRLVDLENRILGVERQGDLPGVMIPYFYFDYLRTQAAFHLVPIFHHNAMDILSLACLTAIVPLAFRAPDETVFRHGADLIGLARWLVQSGRPDDALRLFRRAVDLGLPDDLLFRTLWDVAVTEKRCGRTDAAVEAFYELTAARNSYRARAFEELAKHYERRERNYELALDMTERSLALEETAPLRRREHRLRKKLGHAASAASPWTESERD